jgi:hypothetical protein
VVYKTFVISFCLHPKELETINNIARKLGITEEESQFRRKHFQILFPQGVDLALEKINQLN